VRDITVHSRDHDLVIASHGRGMWIVDDISPLRALSAQTLNSEVAFLPGRPVQQRIASNGGWANGDATFVGENPPQGAAITYFLRQRQVIGKMTIEILDQSGAVVDTVGPGIRKGLNRAFWPMRTKPPHVPPAAQIAGNSTQGPRFLPGNYTVRLTRAGQVYTMPLTVGLDRRATYSLADRKAQFEAANRVEALFNRMSVLVNQILALRAQAGAIGGKLPQRDPLRAQLMQLAERADALRKQVVATKEGGAITGEERLREQTDYAYGAIMATEGAPTPYAMARLDTLDRELSDVEASFATLRHTDLPALNDKLKAKAIPPLIVPAMGADGVSAAGGKAEALFRGMLGSRYRGVIDASASVRERY